MTNIEKKALELLNEVCVERGLIGGWNKHTRETHVSIEALCRAIEQHETDIADLQSEYDEVCKLFEDFRQEVSDAVEAVFAGYHDAPIPWVVMRRKLEPFIIAKPDPLVDAVDELWTQDRDKAKYMADQLHKYLAARGLEIREKQ